MKFSKGRPEKSKIERQSVTGTKHPEKIGKVKRSAKYAMDFLPQFFRSMLCDL